MATELQTDKIAPPVVSLGRQVDPTIWELVQYVKALQSDIAKLRSIIDSL